jgi:acetoin utilization deacetylase AcuC-like enzyme
MIKTAFVYDDIFLRHEMPDMHPESQYRLKGIVSKLKGSDVWDKLLHLEPEKASDDELHMVHDSPYIETVKNYGSGYLDPDTYMSNGTYEAALYAAGSPVTAVKKCLDGEIQRAFCAVRPPGHHAEADRAMGFCIFNNVAVGARAAQKLGYSKVFIVDFDVHHGNGTQHIFYDDPTVFYFSTHQYPYYPGTGDSDETGSGKGKGFTCNIPMRHGLGDKEMHEAYHTKLHELVAKFSPDIMFVSSGYDIHRNDPLAGLAVTDDGIVDIVRGILGAKKGIPAIFCLEGGYNVEALSNSVLATARELLTFE